MLAKKFTAYLFFIILNFLKGILSQYYCYDALNIQARLDGVSPTSSGVVACDGSYDGYCGIILSTGGGLCLASAVSTTSIIYIGPGVCCGTVPSVTSISNYIASCINPLTGETLVASAYKTILACYTSRKGVGSVVEVTKPAGTGVNTSPGFKAAGSYCFTTNCNIGVFNSAKRFKKDLVFSVSLLALIYIHIR